MKISKSLILLTSLLIGSTSLIASSFQLHDLMDDKSKGLSFGGLNSDLDSISDGVGLVLLKADTNSDSDNLNIEQTLTNDLLIQLKNSEIDDSLKDNILDNINSSNSGIPNVDDLNQMLMI